MKKIFLIFALLIILVVPVLAQEDFVCCKEVGGDWCRNVEQSQCLSTLSSYTSCSSVPECNMGTCILSNGGECQAGISQVECTSKDGYWDPSPMKGIEACQPTCCVIGNFADLLLKIECSRIGKEMNLKPKFLSGFSTKKQCQEESFLKSRGACVDLSGSEGIDCFHTTKEECDSSGNKFYRDSLCTAPGISDCAIPSKPETICGGPGEEDIYFLDTCGNVANKMATSREQNDDYWTTMKDDYSDGDYSGDCDFMRKGTRCKPEGSSHKCVESASCKNVDDGYGNKIDYNHGDRWCYNEGALTEDVQLNIDLNEDEFMLERTRVDLENGYRELNLPGSRYYVMQCYNGEVIPVPCADFRNQVCKEGLLEDEVTEDIAPYAVCATNRYAGCIYSENKTDCESNDKDCKWLGWGYRFDGQTIPYYGISENPDGKKERAQRDEEQGSCVPLYAPGMDFWNSSEENMAADSAYCGLASYVEDAVFERSLDLVVNDGMTSEELFRGEIKEITKRCFEGACFAIPDYGLADKNLAPYRYLGSPKNIEEVHEGIEEINLETSYLSERKGYYCHKKRDENDTRTGKIRTSNVKCAENIKKRNQIPVFTNHGVWVDFLQERARSMGDCGYKQPAWTLKSGEDIFGNPMVEVLSADYQKLDQDMQVTQDHKTKNIYVADTRYVEDYRSSEVFEKEDGSAYYWRDYSWWKALHKDKDTGIEEIPDLGNKNTEDDLSEQETQRGSQRGTSDGQDDIPDFGDSSGRRDTERDAATDDVVRFDGENPISSTYCQDYVGLVKPAGCE
ncbi:MAG: hypothetical protein PF542_01380 [Nanoarchaeota archaeon]|jgi:hypothetical protein|nr:hypothetical protein [Nanoarchaeota archaeon]